MDAKGNKLWLAAKRIAVFPFVLLIRVYQVCISPYKMPCCRFTPTCSQYGLEAFRRHGPVKGFFLTARRILSCRPGGGSGYDPVPEEFHYKDIFHGKKRKNTDAV